MSLDISVTRQAEQASQSVLTDAGVLILTGRINALLQLSIPEETIVAALKNCLDQDYGSQNVDLRSGIVYRYLWDPELEEWVQVCIQTNNFSVEDGGPSPLIVDLGIESRIAAARAA